jgi:hypothetical protein
MTTLLVLLASTLHVSLKGVNLDRETVNKIKKKLNQPEFPLDYDNTDEQQDIETGFASGGLKPEYQF